MSNSRRHLGKYLAFARLGYAQARAEPAELYSRVVFQFLILGVFSALWRAVALSGADVGGDVHALVWYIAITEWILMSAPMIHFSIEDDVRRGDVAYQITRPLSYLGAQFAQSVGALAVRAPLLLVATCVAGWTFGGAPAHPLAVVRAMAFGVGGALLFTAYNVVLGLAAFWIGDIAPVYWIWQKFTFLLGGLLLPLPLYPGIVVSIARFTPFPVMLTGPASFVLNQPFFNARVLSGALVAWMVLAISIATLLFTRATRTLQINGG